MKKSGLILLLAIASFAAPESAEAQQELQTRWWTRPRVVERLGLTAQQRANLDAVFERSRGDLVAIRTELQKRALELRQQLDRPESDTAAILRAGDRVSEARARLFRRELVMLTEMKGVLQPYQWEAVRRVLGSSGAPVQHRPGRGPRQPF